MCKHSNYISSVICGWSYREYLSFCADVLMNPVWNCNMNTLMEVIFPWTFPPNVDRPWYTTIVTSPCKVRFTGNDTLPSPRVYSLKKRREQHSFEVQWRKCNLYWFRLVTALVGLTFWTSHLIFSISLTVVRTLCSPWYTSINGRQPFLKRARKHLFNTWRVPQLHLQLEYLLKWSPGKNQAWTGFETMTLPKNSHTGKYSYY